MENGDRALDVLREGYEKAETWYVSCKNHVQELLDEVNSKSPEQEGEIEMLQQALRIATEDLRNAEQRVNEWREKIEEYDIDSEENGDILPDDGDRE